MIPKINQYIHQFTLFMKMLKTHSLDSFQVYNSVSSTAVTMLYTMHIHTQYIDLGYELNFTHNFFDIEKLGSSKKICNL